MDFFNDALVDKIHYESNLYHTQKDKTGNITKEEIYVFLGIIVIMGYNKLPSIRHYWMNSDNMGVKSIQKAMTRDRFKFILGKLHLNDNSEIDKANPDKLWKIKSLINHLNASFQEKCKPNEHLSVDKSMIQFKGRSSIKQYNPMKPIKRGYKVWCIAGNSGYVYRFEIYVGKRTNNECQKTLLLDWEEMLWFY